MPQNPDLFLSIGKSIKDEYGREVGKVVSFALTPNGKFDSVFIEEGDGRFVKCSVDCLKFDDSNNPVLLSDLKLHANVLCDQIPLIWRKDQALKELSSKNKISKELSEELHNSFEGALTQLKNEAQKLIGEVEKEITRCANQIRDLNYALVHLELEHEIGKIDDQSYQEAFAIIQENLKKANMEKSDMEQTKSKLSNILLGETPLSTEPEKMETPPKSSTLAAEMPGLPEPPVIVYVKEVGKASI